MCSTGVYYDHYKYCDYCYLALFLQRLAQEPLAQGSPHALLWAPSAAALISPLPALCAEHLSLVHLCHSVSSVSQLLMNISPALLSLLVGPSVQFIRLCTAQGHHI